MFERSELAPGISLRVPIFEKLGVSLRNDASTLVHDVASQIRIAELDLDGTNLRNLHRLLVGDKPAGQGLEILLIHGLEPALVPWGAGGIGLWILLVCHRRFSQWGGAKITHKDGIF